MAFVAPPVGVTVAKKWHHYHNALGRSILYPLIISTRQRIDAAGRDYVRIRDAIRDIPNDPRMAGLTANAARIQFQRIKKEHTDEYERVMRRYFGVRYRVTDTPQISAMLDRYIDANVRLIKTIPARLHDPLIRELTTLINNGSAFDEQKLSQILRQQFNSSGYNLRRITRDQTSKAVGNLNHIRQTDAGIREYVWSTSEDERVRPTHVMLNGKIYSWDGTPQPPEGHPGHPIQCRCVARAIIRNQFRKNP